MGRKRVLFVLNSPSGGATQGIKEYLIYQKDIDAYIVLPSKPNLIQEQWINLHTKGYFICDMPWWNIPNGLPWVYQKILFWKNNLKGHYGEKGAEKIIEFIKSHSIDYVYTGSILIREGAIAAKKTGVKHFWHIKETFGKNGRVKFALKDKDLQEFILNHSEKVICMTNYIKSFFNQLGNSQKLIVIHDGIDPNLFFDDSKTKRLEIRKKYGISDKDILVGMVASFSSIWKNHEVFIKAIALMKKSKSFRFIAFGSEPRKYNNPIYNTSFKYFMGLKKQVISLGIQDKFVWAGFYDDIPTIFQGLDIFVHPCETEPFGRVVIEAIASGVLVIVPEEGGASEPIDELGFGYKFKSNDEKHLAKVIQELSLIGHKRVQTKNNSIISNSTYTLDSYVKLMNNLFE
jgi:glycosyltransferase involved in cell wall biosynthesis